MQEVGGAVSTGGMGGDQSVVAKGTCRRVGSGQEGTGRRPHPVWFQGREDPEELPKVLSRGH